MKSPSNQLFTCSQIAFSLGRSRQSIQQLLRSVPLCGHKLAGGNLAGAWSYSALPWNLKAELENLAQAKGFRNAEHLLSSPAEPWQPELPMAEIGEQFLSKASKLRDALAPALARRNDTTITRAEFDRMGAEDYARCFGYAVSDRHWRRLFDRTIELDRGLEQWNRLEIYLDDNIGKKSSFAKPAPKVRFVHAPLNDLMSSLEDKVEPTSADRE